MKESSPSFFLIWESRAGQGWGGIDQPGNIGVQAGLLVIFGVPVAVGAFVLLAVRRRGRA